MAQRDGPITHILFGTDFSETAAAAQPYVRWLADRCKASVTVMHVVEFQPGLDPELPVNRDYLTARRESAAAELDRVVQAFAGAGPSTPDVEITAGLPSREIIQTAEGRGADLVVLGTRGKTGLAHLLLGSTAERVIAGAPCPVLAVKAQAGTGEAGMRRLLVALDSSDCSLDALEYGVKLATALDLHLTLMHGLEPIAYGLDFTIGDREAARQARERWESRLRELCEDLRDQGVKADCWLRGGIPADAIRQAAVEDRSDVIVMGTHGRRGLAHAWLGSVTESVLRRAPCPVLTVRTLPHGRKAQED